MQAQKNGMRLGRLSKDSLQSTKQHLSIHFYLVTCKGAIESIERTGEKIWLTRGLVVCSIEDSIMDQRDNIIYLSRLYVAAEEKSLNPKPEFQAIAEISSDEISSGGNVSMSELMKNIPNIARTTYENWKEYS